MSNRKLAERIEFRLTTEELDILETYCSRLCITKTSVLRHMVRQLKYNGGEYIKHLPEEDEEKGGD